MRRRAHLARLDEGLAIDVRTLRLDTGADRLGEVAVFLDGGEPTELGAEIGPRRPRLSRCDTDPRGDRLNPTRAVALGHSHQRALGPCQPLRHLGAYLAGLRLRQTELLRGVTHQLVEGDQRRLRGECGAPE